MRAAANSVRLRALQRSNMLLVVMHILHCALTSYLLMFATLKAWQAAVAAVCRVGVHVCMLPVMSL